MSMCRIISPIRRYALHLAYATPAINLSTASHLLKHQQDTEAFIPRADERAIQAQVQELMCYIWDNYLQLYDSVDDIFLMGVGNAYLGIKVLLINRRRSSLISRI